MKFDNPRMITHWNKMKEIEDDLKLVNKEVEEPFNPVISTAIMHCIDIRTELIESNLSDEELERVKDIYSRTHKSVDEAYEILKG